MPASIPLKSRTASLFARLLLSFLVIVLLLAAIDFMSFRPYRDRVRNEILRYNTVNMNNLKDNFAQQTRYRNLSSFNRMFKKFIGIAPSEFRQTKPSAP